MHKNAKNQMGKLFKQGKFKFQLPFDADAAGGHRQHRRARAVPPHTSESFKSILCGGPKGLSGLLQMEQVA